MRYIVLIISLAIIVWGIWVFNSPNASDNLNRSLAICKSIDPSGIDGLKCNGIAYKAHDDLENKAMWSIIIGTVLAIVSGVRIQIKNEEHRIKETFPEAN